jgi:hypothetical protein
MQHSLVFTDNLEQPTGPFFKSQAVEKKNDGNQLPIHTA